MPANLPQQYYLVEKRYRAAKTTAEKLAALEEMLSIMPKHKGTDKLQADLKRRISKLKNQGEKGGPKKAFSFSVKPEGAGQVALVGPPNSGKSSLLKALTRAEPEIADYPFTTRAPLAGMARFEDIQIQLVDLPPVSEEYLEAWLFEIIKRADLSIVLLDLTDDPLHQLETLERILAEKNIFLAGGPPPPPEARGRIRPCLLAANKLDAEDSAATLELFLEMLEPKRPVLPLSAAGSDRLDDLVLQIFMELKVIRVYSKSPGKPPALDQPFTLPQGATVMDLAEKIHREIAEKFKFARIWSENKYDGQMVQRDHVLADRDVIEVHF